MPSHANATGTELHEDKRIKEPARAASTGNVTLATPGASMDGVTLVAGDRVLLKDQTTASQNGIYVWSGASSALTRATDADSATDFVTGFKVFVLEGTTNASSYWNFTTIAAVTVGTTSLSFVREAASSASEITGVDFKPTGLTGATSASRYVGATASAAPASGTFVLGDFVLDQTGQLWICTVGGTPGTWRQVGGTPPYANFQDQKAQNTAGGTFTSGAWQTRTLNTTQSNTASIASLSSNQLTLAAGTYRVQIKAPAAGVNWHQARLQNITDTTTTLLGTVEEAGGAATGVTTSSWVSGRFTIAASKVFEVQHRCTLTTATQGFGTPGNITTEVYTVIEIWKEA